MGAECSRSEATAAVVAAAADATEFGESDAVPGILIEGSDGAQDLGNVDSQRDLWRPGWREDGEETHQPVSIDHEHQSKGHRLVQKQCSDWLAKGPLVGTAF